MQTTVPPNTVLVDVLNAGANTYTVDANSRLNITLPAMVAPAQSATQGGPSGYPARILVPQSQVASGS